MATQYEAVIGLEVHAQLLTRTKAFCGCETSFGDAPNTHVCATCGGLPGGLPVLNAEAVRMAALAGLALGCTIQYKSVFARKNYFYPDLPKGYQISQYDQPICKDGSLSLEGERGETTVRIERIHIEEDAGKNVHGVGGRSIVDLNRAGTPLIEIVSHPDLRSAADASEYLRALRDILLFIGVNDGNLEEGSFRCDANVSIRPRGESALGTRVELKNINSFRFVEKAIDSEIARQIAVVSSGAEVKAETRGWSEQKASTFSMRSKETADDYRYFPDPDLPPLVLDDAWIAARRGELPELPLAKAARYRSAWGLPAPAARVLTQHPKIAELFEATVALGADPRRAGNFIQGEVLRDTKTSGIHAELPIAAPALFELLGLVDASTISLNQAKTVYEHVRRGEGTPTEIVKKLGIEQVSDTDAIAGVCREVIASHPDQVAAFRAGKQTVFGFLMGAAMKASKGQANPKLVSSALRKMLEEDC